MTTVTARACSNIAFIKYWGNADDRLRLPVNPSLSMNLEGLYTETSVRWDPSLSSDVLIFNNQPTTGTALSRVSQHLDIIRQRAGQSAFAHVSSFNNFPTGAGIASSASSFAALTVAACAAAGLDVTERELTTLARLGSGSASRSVPTGFVQWHTGERHEDSYAESFAAPDHWNLVDVIAIVSSGHKDVGSREGHQSASTSDLQNARVAGAQERFDRCKRAILERDFATFADVVEHDSNLMHAVMMTSRPPLFYWMPSSLTVMSAVRQWRAEGLKVCYTLDAGPNVHCLCLAEDAPIVEQRLMDITGVQEVRRAAVGGAAAAIQMSDV
ncbi:MAG: diphosphomevalonate decarboxylase [bacterium]|nr:diphosphomevalonate decarboxylase [bacterium]